VYDKRFPPSKIQTGKNEAIFGNGEIGVNANDRFRNKIFFKKSCVLNFPFGRK